MTGIVELVGMEFFAKHGCHPEERKLGNKYTVDVLLKVDMEQAVVADKLEGTVDYERVYAIVQRVMSKEVNLLEHLAGTIGKELKESFGNVLTVKVSISKHQPPIGGLCDRARVTVEL
jgi:dihydroneopterin aldolase